MKYLDYVIDMICLNDEFDEIVSSDDPDKALEYVLDNLSHYKARIKNEIPEINGRRSLRKLIKTKTFQNAYPNLAELAKKMYERR